MLAEEGTGYDVVLCLDVLEHLVDPAGALAALRGLAPRGRALISLPNVAHWSLRKELLRGRWEYTESGLLDRTHLRFYTLDTARSLLSQAGWRVEWESSSPGQPPLVRLPAQRLGVLQRWPRLFGVQLLFDAVPA